MTSKPAFQPTPEDYGYPERFRYLRSLHAEGWPFDVNFKFPYYLGKHLICRIILMSHWFRNTDFMKLFQNNSSITKWLMKILHQLICKLLILYCIILYKLLSPFPLTYCCNALYMQSSTHTDAQKGKKEAFLFELQFL